MVIASAGPAHARGARPWTTTGWRSLALLSLAVLLLRSASFVFGVADIDETDFIVIGRVMREGGLPFVDVIDIKPPLLYLLYLPSALFTWRVWPMQILGVAWVVATCLVLGRAATRWTRRPEAGAAAAWLCAIASASNVLSINAELLLNLPAAIALLCFVRAEQEGRPARDYLAAGIAVGLASLIKHQAGILLVALALAQGISWWRTRGSRELSPGAPAATGGELLGRLVSLGAGFALPWVAAGAIYAGLGHFSEFYEWNVTRNLHYAGHAVGSPLRRFVEGTAAYIVGAVPLLWLLAGRESLRVLGRGGAGDRGRIRAGLALALWLTFIPVSLGGRFYHHYYLQFVPPLCLLAAAPASLLWRRWQRLSAGPRRALALALLAPLVVAQAIHFGRGLAGNYPSQEPRARAIADWLRANSRPDERVVVYGHFSPIYQQAERLPGARYIHASEMLGNFDATQLPDGFDVTPFRSTRDEAVLIEDMTRHRPAFFVDTSTADIKGWRQLPLRSLPALAAHVAAHYQQVAAPGGASVYRLREAGGRSGTLP